MRDWSVTVRLLGLFDLQRRARRNAEVSLAGIARHRADGREARAATSEVQGESGYEAYPRGSYLPGVPVPQGLLQRPAP
jgi:hypothetical protein